MVCERFPGGVFYAPLEVCMAKMEILMLFACLAKMSSDERKGKEMKGKERIGQASQGKGRKGKESKGDEGKAGKPFVVQVGGSSSVG